LTLVANYKSICEAEKKLIADQCGAKSCDECVRSDVVQLQGQVNQFNGALTAYGTCVNTNEQINKLDGAQVTMNNLVTELQNAKDASWLKAVKEGPLDCRFVPEDNCKRFTTDCQWDDGTSGCVVRT